MFLTNDTEDVAGLLRCERPNDEIAAALIVRRRFRVLPDGALEAPDRADRLESLRMVIPEEDDWGLIPPDDFYPRCGTDVIILGEAVCREPSVATRVSVRVGPYDVSLDVFGDRVWESVLGNLIPSEPQPFLRMPVTYKRAYGGAAPADYGPMPWYNNPSGKGYYLRRGDAVGAPLPNIESPEHPVKCWDDQPDPVGFAPYPFAWGLRAARCARFNEATSAMEIFPEEGLFDRGHPLLSGKEIVLLPGETMPMFVNGMSERASLRIDVPACPYEAVISVGDNTVVRELGLEEILFDARNGLLDLTYRKMFRYPYWAEELRHTLLRPRRSC